MLRIYLFLLKALRIPAVGGQGSRHIRASIPVLSGHTFRCNPDVCSGVIRTSTVPQFGSATFAYDITANLTAGYVGESTTISGRAVTRVYDKAGRLYQVKEGANVISTYAYYANGSLQTQTLPNSVTDNYIYFANNRLQTLQNKKGGTILEAYRYTYDGTERSLGKVKDFDCCA